MFFANFFKPKPFNEGYLPSMDGHKVFFMEFGNPKGEVILTTHGGPGWYCDPSSAKAYNLRKYRVIMFDQRGCGKSLPLGEIKNNNTQKIISDMERLLNYLNVKDKIILSGSSWSATLVLLYAIKYPHRISKMLLSKVFIPGEEYRKWMLEGVAKFYPDIMDEIKKQAKDARDIPAYYAKLINSDKASEQYKAFKYYGAYEFAIGSFEPKIVDRDVNDYMFNYSKIFINYDAENCFLNDGDILGKLKNIENIPTIIVHNRLDLLCTLQGAYDLHKGMKKSKLIIVPEMGHNGPLLSEIRKKEFKKFLEGK